MKSRHVVLARRPNGAPVPEDFRVETRELGELPDGRVTVQVLYTTANPGSRGRLDGTVASYVRPLNIGETMEGPTVGRVIETRHPDFAVGDLVWGASGWAEHVQVGGRALNKIAKDTQHLSAWGGVLNIPGLTGYFALRDVGLAKAGETVLVSSAAGPVGATAGQIARIMGCKVIGIASGDVRRDWLLKEAKFNAVIDDITARFEAAREFVLPGENRLAAALDVARTVVRRAEREAVAATDEGWLEPGSSIVPYLNRLADLVYTLARWQEGHFRAVREAP